MPDPGPLYDGGGEVLNVAGFPNVYPNQAVDSTAGIQHVLNVAPKFATVVLPAGKYRVSALIVNQTARLLGPGTLLGTGSGVPVLSVAATAPDTVIDGVRFIGNGSQRFIDVRAGTFSETSTPPHLDPGPARVTVRNCYFGRRAYGDSDVSGYGDVYGNAIRFTLCDQPVVEGNFFEWSAATAPEPVSTETNGQVLVAGGFGAVVRHNQVWRTTGMAAGNRGIVVIGCSDAQITHNVLESFTSDLATTGTVIQLWSARGSPVRGGTIAHNTIVGAGAAAIYLKNEVIGAVVHGNTIRGFGRNHGIYVADACDHTVITGNVVADGTADVDGIRLGPIDAYGTETPEDTAPAYCIVSDNLVTANRFGIALGGRGHRVSDNISRQNDWAQLVFTATARDCHAYDNLLESQNPANAPYYFEAGEQGSVLRMVTRSGSTVTEEYRIANP